ncbi:MAG: hypothetical protein HY075_13530 [Deltaproteobacteria bacterium]|nr:hypothetical protein [Deltaproteobacteria bacterium]
MTPLMLVLSLVALQSAPASAAEDFEIPIDVDLSELDVHNPGDLGFEIEEAKSPPPIPAEAIADKIEEPATPPPIPDDAKKKPLAGTPARPADELDIHIEVEESTMPAAKTYPASVYSQFEHPTMPAATEYPFLSGPRITPPRSAMAGLPSLLRKDPIRYYVVQDVAQPLEGIGHDVETAIQVWFKTMGKHDAWIGRAASAADADIIIHVGTTSLNPDGVAAGAMSTSFLSGETFRDGRPKPVIELLSNTDGSDWTTISDGTKESAVTITHYHGRKVLATLKHVFGVGRDGSITAERLLRHKPRIDGEGDLTVADAGIKRLAYAHLFRQLGSVLGFQHLIDKQQDLVPNKGRHCEYLLTR